MVQQRQAVRKGPEFHPERLQQPLEDFGSNSDAARAVGPTPTLGAFGDSHEQVQVGGSETVTVNGVELTLGQINAMGDFVGSVEALYAIDEATLLALRDAMERHAADPNAVGSGEIGAIVGEQHEELEMATLACQASAAAVERVFANGQAHIDDVLAAMTTPSPQGTAAVAVGMCDEIEAVMEGLVEDGLGSVRQRQEPEPEQARAPQHYGPRRTYGLPR